MKLLLKMPSRFQMNYTQSQFSQFFHSRTKIIFCNITNHVHPLVDSFIYRHVLSKRNFFLRENICNVYKEREEERMNLNFKKMMQIFHMEFEIQTQTKPTPSKLFLETHRSRSFTHFNIHETIEPRFPAPSETIFWLLNWP